MCAQEIKASKRDFGRVAVLMGGWSREREISLQSGRAVLSALRSHGVDAFEMDIRCGADLVRLGSERCDRVFIAMHGRGGEDGVVQGLLEAMHIPYTGSGVLGSALAMDKLMSKRLWCQMGLPTPDFRELAQGFDAADVVEMLGLPLAVKPVLEGSSLGVHRVDSAEQLYAAWADAASYGCQVIAEQWISGDEYTVGFLCERILTPLKLKYDQREFYDYQAKYEDRGTRYLHCGLPLHETAQVQALAYRAAEALHVAGWGRIDLMRDRGGQFWLLEANTVPGMTTHSLIPKAAHVEGLSFEWAALEILATSLNGEAHK